MSAYRPTRSRGVFPVVIVFVILLAALAVGFLLGTLLSGGPDEAAQESLSPIPSSSGVASNPATASADPSGSAGASGEPAPSGDGTAPSPVVTAPEGIIPPGSVVRVLADGLRLRAEPSADSTLVQSLPADQLLIVGFAPQRGDFGPMSAGGFAWHPVLRLGDLTELPPLSDGPIDSDSASGWVAAGDTSGPFIELVGPRCPPRPVDLATLEAMLPWEQLACLGNETITVEGTFGCGGCGGLFPGTFEPAWLAHPNNVNLLSVDASQRIGPFTIRLPPDGPEPPDVAAIIRVTGHFDDATAAGCTISPGEAPTPIDAQSAELYCRERFVVESYEVIGTDPDFPFG